MFGFADEHMERGILPEDGWHSECDLTLINTA